MINKIFSQGDIFLVRFHPSFGRELKKYRPVIILSKKQFDPRFTTIVPLTSSNTIVYPESEISIKNECLNNSSTVLCWYPLTIDIDRLEYKLGEVDKKIVQNIFNLVKKNI